MILSIALDLFWAISFGLLVFAIVVLTVSVVFNEWEMYKGRRQ